MPNFAIRAEGLGKKYRIGTAAEPYGTLRDTIVNLAKAPARRLAAAVRQGGQPARTASFWALEDVSFQVNQGEVLGIVGRNGAGKSTLLKVLSRITEPTTGRAEVHGRVGSLLEVGTGFHPELTGRDNVFLNGSILGMDRAYIQRRFDEIVEFSGAARFIDTPVKRYSSGMYLRLAFAVAAHLETEVLVMDEVLAVGDAEFQKKCLGKMGEVAQGGRTVLFVSHNLAAISRLCTRAILLEGGRLKLDGSVSQVAAEYTAAAQATEFSDARRQHRSPEISIVDAWLEHDGAPAGAFAFGDTLDLLVKVRANVPQRFGVEIALRDREHTPVVFFGSGIQQRLEFQAPAGESTVRVRVPGLPLAEGRYHLDLALAETGRRFLDYLESALAFDVEVSDPMGTGIHYRQGGKGSVYVPSEFAVVDGLATPVQD
ncbi:MAG: ABC transporter ATP-binding protein [Gemmatimonadetes bacterium]|nr:ABC transporter ATP-binding protein [Gemmatimonadota bacterium]